MALRGTPRGDELAILIDSAAVVQRLRWFRSHDFRPAEHKVKDYDIIYEILRELTQVAIRIILTNSFCKIPWSLW